MRKTWHSAQLELPLDRTARVMGGGQLTEYCIRDVTADYNLGPRRWRRPGYWTGGTARALTVEDVRRGMQMLEDNTHMLDAMARNDDMADMVALATVRMIPNVNPPPRYHVDIEAFEFEGQLGVSSRLLETPHVDGSEGEIVPEDADS